MATVLLVGMGAVAAARAMAMKTMAVARAVSKVVVQALVAQVMERKRVMEASRVAAALAMAMSKVAAQALVALAMAVSKVAIPPRAKLPTRLNRLSLLLKMCLGPVRRKKSKSLKFSGSQVVGYFFGTGGLSMWM